MRRGLLTFFSALSLLVAVTLCLLWPSSHSFSRTVHWVRLRDAADAAGPRTSVDLMVSRGGVTVGLRRWTPRRDRPVGEEERPGFHYEWDLPWGPTVSWLGFAASHSRNTIEGDYDSVRAPNWLLVPLLAAPAVRLLAMRVYASRARLPGHCRACGYDLRATPDRCPECGGVPERGVA